MIYTLTLNPALDRELTVPAFCYDQVLRTTSIRVDYGGKGFNVSRALMALGMESIALGFVGGSIGESLTAGLNKLGIQTDFIRIEDETRINTSILNEDHSHYLKVNAPGPIITLREQTTMLEKIHSLSQSNDWWVLAGSLPPGIPPTFYAEVIRIVQSAGSRAILDTQGTPLRKGCTANPYLIKPNVTEASELTSKQIVLLSDAIAAVPQLHYLGAQQVSISLGSKGAVYSDGQWIWSAETPVIQEQNPTGAGDALVAGLIWGFCNNQTGEEVIRWGVACGSAAASLPGTAMGSRSQIERLAGQVHIDSTRMATKQ